MTNSNKNWTEDFHLENGNYINICSYCTCEFIGHKKRFVCNECYGDRMKIFKEKQK